MRHSKQLRKTGSPTGSLRAAKPMRRCDQCLYGGCDHLHETLGLCAACYARRRYRQQHGLPPEPLHEPPPNSRQKLTPDDLTAIRAWYTREAANGLRMLDIAKHCGVSKGCISQVIRSE